MISFARLVCCAVLALAVPVPCGAQVPAAYPSSYAETIAAARKEGKVVIYSSTDEHLNRCKNMDTRTPQADIRFVA